jgi:excisionase family DNA binding protein
MNSPLVLTIRETAARAGIPVAFVRRLVAEGSVHAVRSGSRFYVTWASVERYLLGEEERLITTAKRNE